ncbi:Probable oxygen-independent coproporphyrinogen III oxidase HemN [Mycobacteroides abscessus subsp. bolletii]|nr:Probable oxygen-independent coproporphyrinogen III oxidase HemN [Mycobacteroides abscessus subsp. bolletii]
MRPETTATLPPLVPAPGRPFGIYVHVPFCATRCGYCDFNTYTADELGEGTSPAGFYSRRPWHTLDG